MPRLAPSIILLVLANMLPVVGVLWWGWSVFSVMLLYWLENIIVGLLNIPRILFASGGEDNSAQPMVKRLFTAVFFSVHYGLFTFVHGAFVFSMFAEGQYEEPTPALVWQLVSEQHLYWAVLALSVSHLASLVLNYLLAGEYRQVTVKEMMRKPYGRIVVLHLGIIFGGILLDILSAPLVGLIVLLLIKTIFDVRSHIMEHRSLEPEAPLVD
jgi:hypothetical protein